MYPFEWYVKSGVTQIGNEDGDIDDMRNYSQWK